MAGPYLALSNIYVLSTIAILCLGFFSTFLRNSMKFAADLHAYLVRAW